MYMQRKSVVHAKNTINKHVFMQYECKTLLQQQCITYTPIFLNWSDTFMFLITMLQCQTVLETIFFQFKLIGWKLKITHLDFSASL